MNMKERMNDNLFIASRIIEIRSSLFELLGQEKYNEIVADYKEAVIDTMETQKTNNPLEAAIVLMGATKSLANEGKIKDPDIYIHWFIAAAYDIICEGNTNVIKRFVEELKNRNLF